MLHWKRWLTATLLLVVAAVLGACAAAPTPTPTAKPAAAATATKAPAASPTPTTAAIRFEGGKFQPLPDGYPNKPIRFYTSKVGSGDDIFTRNITKAAQQFSPVPLVVENRPESPIAMLVTARGTDPTGYVVSYASGSSVSGNYVEGQNLVLGKDYKPVIFANTTDTVFPVKADAPWKTMKDFLDYAKANPGLRLGVPVSGSMHHVVCEWLAKDAGVKWVCVPHAASGDVVRSIMAGDVSAGTASLAAVQPQAEAGKVRILATSSSDKLTKHPDAVRFTDLGLKVQYDHFYGYLAPGEVPDLRVQWLSALLKKATEDPEFQKWTDSIGQRILGFTADQATAMLKQLDPIVAQLTKDLGMRP